LFGKAIWSSSGPGQWLAAHVDAILYDTEGLKAADDMLVCTDYEQFTLQQQQGPLCVSQSGEEAPRRTLRQPEVAQSESLAPSHLCCLPDHGILPSLLDQAVYPWTVYIYLPSRHNVCLHLGQGRVVVALGLCKTRASPIAISRTSHTPRSQAGLSQPCCGPLYTISNRRSFYLSFILVPFALSLSRSSCVSSASRKTTTTMLSQPVS
jgi:hypothetical protein